MWFSVHGGIALSASSWLVSIPLRSSLWHYQHIFCLNINTCGGSVNMCCTKRLALTSIHLPERGDAVAGGPPHHEAPLGARAPLAHLVHAPRRPHLAHAHLRLLLEVVGRPAEQKSGVHFSRGAQTLTRGAFFALTWLWRSPGCR